MRYSGGQFPTENDFSEEKTFNLKISGINFIIISQVIHNRFNKSGVDE
jgi:hypothetical protein